MKLVLVMNLDNAAFDTGYDDIKDGLEAARILKMAVEAFDSSGLKVGRAVSLWDSNGNKVGMAQVVA